MLVLLTTPFGAGAAPGQREGRRRTRRRCFGARVDGQDSALPLPGGVAARTRVAVGARGPVAQGLPAREGAPVLAEKPGRRPPPRGCEHTRCGRRLLPPRARGARGEQGRSHAPRAAPTAGGAQRGTLRRRRRRRLAARSEARRPRVPRAPRDRSHRVARARLVPESGAKSGGQARPVARCALPRGAAALGRRGGRHATW